MGLDQYLQAKKYTSKYSKDKDLSLNDKIWELCGIEKGDNLGSAEIILECGYWRKSNQIHKWFIDNCGEGDDNCREMEVSREQLKELKELCEKVLKILSEQTRKKVMLKDRFSKEDYEHEVYEDTEEIEELLPHQQGFFFGGYEYDEYYKDDLEQTIEIINKCFEKFDDDWTFSYYASW